MANYSWPLASTEHLLIYSKSHNWKVIFSVSKQLSIMNRFLVRDGMLCLLLHAEILLALSLCTSFVCCRFLWVNMYIFSVVSQKYCFIEVIQQWWLLEFFCCLFLTVLWVLRSGRGVLKTSHFWLRSLKFLSLCTLSNLGYLCWFLSIRRGFFDEDWGIQ